MTTLRAENFSKVGSIAILNSRFGRQLTFENFQLPQPALPRVSCRGHWTRCVLHVCIYILQHAATSTLQHALSPGHWTRRLFCVCMYTPQHAATSTLQHVVSPGHWTRCLFRVCIYTLQHAATSTRVLPSIAIS